MILRVVNWVDRIQAHFFYRPLEFKLTTLTAETLALKFRVYDSS